MMWREATWPLIQQKDNDDVKFVTKKPFQRAPGDTSILSVDVVVTAIEALIEERHQAKLGKRYGLLAVLEERLESAFGATLDDKQQLWTSNGLFAKKEEIGYQQSSLSEPCKIPR